MDENNHREGHPPRTHVEIGEPISQDTEAWVAVGRKLLDESIVVGRDYAKFMIQFSFGAIPIYISLLGLTGRSASHASELAFGKLIILLSPVLLFIISSLLFILAYYPKAEEIVVNVVETIKSTQQRIISRQRRLNIVATSIFAVAVFSAVVLLLLPA